ncbi:MAG: DNRLRE domain-containing protein [Clostridia bacterium]|nr:DNRLRE domain-containing protein [Clostridia bacterium]
MKTATIPELAQNEAFCRESVVSYLGCKIENVKATGFDASLSFMLGSQGEPSFEAALLMPGEEGIPVAKPWDVRVTFSEKNVQVTLLALPTEKAFELVVRPFVLGAYGLRRYGTAVVLYYGGKRDEDGKPVLSSEPEKTYEVVASDDTFIFNEENYQHRTTNYGKTDRLQVRNTGDADTDLYRASYFKFTLDEEAVRLLDGGSPARLRLFVMGTEHRPTRKYYNMSVFATDTKWTEDALNYNNHRELAATGELLAKDIHCEGGYLNVDIREHLKKQARGADGSITVSFCVSNEGHEDAIVIFMSSKESHYGKPVIELGTPALGSVVFDLPQSENCGFEPWGYAEMLADEWFGGLSDRIFPRDGEGNLIYHEELGELAPRGYAATVPTGDFTREMKWIPSCCWTENGGRVGFDESHPEKYIRTVETLGTSKGTPFLASPFGHKRVEKDVYGGIANAGFKGQATGFFHTEKHGVRTYIIDPLGNPFFAIGINTVCLGDSDNHKHYSLEKYGDRETYYREISASLKEIGFTVDHLGDVDRLLEQQNGLAVVVGTSVIRPYMNSIGRATLCEGLYPHNNTINVFDPDFVKYARESLGELIGSRGYAQMSNLFGYTTDNEQPAGPDILDRYLLLDPTEPTNAFSYATAWTWVARRMGTAVPTLAAFQSSPEHAKMNSEFLGFLYARYSKVCREALRAADPNHMYIGSRVYHTCLTDEGYLRAAGYYLDIVTVNLYGNANPSLETIRNIYRYSGKPFIVTEFYAKAADSLDASGYPLANSCGAGQLVETQQNRADYYEHYALTLLESGAAVGWTWYRFRDNDQGLYRKVGTDNTMYMCHVTYGTDRHANTFMDESGRLLTAAEVGEFEEIYRGEPMASNQNVNKGIYNSNFHSVVTVYTYASDGSLVDSVSREVEDPACENLADGTVLKARGGSETFTIGSRQTADGGLVRTVLTVCEGKYLAFAASVRRISDHAVGLSEYFAAK